MPTTSTPNNANDYILQQLDAQIAEIEEVQQSNVVAFNGPLIRGVDNIVRVVVEKRTQQTPDRKKLVCILTTDGGYVEVVRRIVDVFRHSYDVVDFIIPDYAYSAGTVLAMSGDDIYMDYYSRLGPIDPQIEGRAGMLPALGYLERYDELIRKAQRGKISTAEVQLLIDGFDQAELSKYEHARDLSIALLEEWLVRYKFKNWGPHTETRKLKVTDAMKRKRAKEIAKQLNNTKKWHSHGHGISREVLDRDLNLKIKDFEADAELNDKVRCYHALLEDFMTKNNHHGSVHARDVYAPFFYQGGPQ